MFCKIAYMGLNLHHFHYDCSTRCAWTLRVHVSFAMTCSGQIPAGPNCIIQMMRWNIYHALRFSQRHPRLSQRQHHHRGLSCAHQEQIASRAMRIHPQAGTWGACRVCITYICTYVCETYMHMKLGYLWGQRNYGNKRM